MLAPPPASTRNGNAKPDVVGHEFAGRLQPIEHRMPPFADVEDRLRRRSPAGSSCAARPRRRARPARRAPPGSRPSPASRRRLAGDAFAQSGEQLLFQRNRLLFGAEDFVLVLLERRRDVAFLVLERLLADVVGRNFLRLGGGDFEVIAEDAVEADFQIGDARAGDLLGLIAGDPFLAAAGQSAQLVELRRDSPL